MHPWSTTSLRLLCEGPRAEAGSSLQQDNLKSLISELTLNATLVCRNVPCLSDGRHDAKYEGRGAHRDVYRIGDYVLKLCTDAKEKMFGSNRLEADCLKKTKDLEQTPVFYYEGRCNIETPQYRNSQNQCITQTVNCIIVSYAGPTFDYLMHACFGRPYDHTVANFFVSAYQELGLMCIDGRYLKIAYSDLHTANISTLLDPASHVPGSSAGCVICDAEGISLGEYSRTVFNLCCDGMIADFQLQCSVAPDESWRFMAASIAKFLNNFFKQNGNVEMDVLKESYLKRMQLLWADICNEHHLRQLTAPRQPPLELQAEHYAAPVSDKVQHAIKAAPWHSTKEARRGDEAPSAEHYATATVSAIDPTRIAASPARSPVVARHSAPAPVEATVPRLAAVRDPEYGRLLCGHRANERKPDCDVCKLLEPNAEALIIDLVNPLQVRIHESVPVFEGPLLVCGHPVAHRENDCLVCEKHYADKDAGSRLVAGGSSKSSTLRLSCGHCFNDLREECQVCQKHFANKEASSRLVAGGSSPSSGSFLTCGHYFDDRRKDCKICAKHYAGKDAVASANRVSMSAPARPVATLARYPGILCRHIKFQKGCLVCVERQARVNRTKSAAPEMKLPQTVTTINEDDARSEVDWSDDQPTPAVPSRKRPSPFDEPEPKKSSPFDAQEQRTSTHAGAETFEVEDESNADDGVTAVSTNSSDDYRGVRLFSRPQISAAELYAEPLSQVVAAELEKQKSSKFRGVGRFQEERVGRMSWKDRVTSGYFPRKPEMTRAQMDDIGRLCKLMYVALHNVLERCDLTPQGEKQRRVRIESEFMKYGMAKRIFEYVSRFHFTDQQWCEPKAVLEAVLIKFDLLCGRHERK